MLRAVRPLRVATLCLAAVLSAGRAARAQASAPRVEVDLAKELLNPVANLVSVPMQSNFDYGGGVRGHGSQYVLNIQPVIPFKRPHRPQRARRRRDTRPRRLLGATGARPVGGGKRDVPAAVRCLLLPTGQPCSSRRRARTTGPDASG